MYMAATKGHGMLLQSQLRLTFEVLWSPLGCGGSRRRGTLVRGAVLLILDVKQQVRFLLQHCS